MKKNDYFIDVSAYQQADLRGTCQLAGTKKTIIKVSEGTGWLSPVRQQQADTSEPVGYYHFARFGGNVAQAQAEANYFISHLPNKKVRYLVCDYEDSASSNKTANTNAIIAFMDVCKKHGYEPIYYSYKPYTLANLDDYHRILNKYNNSLWIASYADYQVRPTVIVSSASWFPYMDGIRWWQFTSTAIAGGLDKNIVLISDDTTTTTTTTTQENLGGLEEMEFTFSVSGDKNYHPNTIYYVNTARGIYRGFKHVDELVVVKNIYKDIYGKDMQHYNWQASAPWYNRLIQGLGLKEEKR